MSGRLPQCVWRNIKFLALPEPQVPEGMWREELEADLQSSSHSGKGRAEPGLGWKYLGSVDQPSVRTCPGPERQGPLSSAASFLPSFVLSFLLLFLPILPVAVQGTQGLCSQEEVILLDTRGEVGSLAGSVRRSWRACQRVPGMEFAQGTWG